MLTFLMLVTAAFESGNAYAKEEFVSSVAQNEFEALLSAKPVYRYSVFTNPATMLNAFPLLGGRGLQLGGEYMSSPNVAGFFYLGYTTYNLKELNKFVERQQSLSSEDENTDEEEDDRKITFYESESMVANIGGRYFFRPSSDGWFLGSLVRYQKDYSKVDYDETIGYVSRVVAGPQGHGGHRWIWRHGGFIDFFAGAFVLAYERQKFKWETDDQERKDSAQKKYEKTAFQGLMRYVVPEINITMGYFFK